MPWIGAAIGVAGSLLSGSMQADASQSAGQTAANAQNRSADIQLGMFNKQNDQQAPYRQAGYQGLNALGNYLGLGNAIGTSPSGGNLTGAFAENPRFMELYQNALNFGQTPQQAITGLNAYAGTNFPTTIASPQEQASGPHDENYGSLLRQFTSGDLNAHMAPNYEFVKQQGIGATTNQLNASGGALSGNALKGVTDYATNLAGNAYQQAYSNYNTNQTNIFNRLASIAGLGQTSNAQSGQLAGALAPGIGGAVAGAGQAQAAGQIGQANAMAGGMNNALGWYQLGNFMKPSSGGNNNYNASGTYQPFYSMGSENYG